jgi:hypothetical protein
LVWEFYHYRRELVLTKEPNKVWHQLNYFSSILDICFSIHKPYLLDVCFIPYFVKQWITRLCITTLSKYKGIFFFALPNKCLPKMTAQYFHGCLNSYIKWTPLKYFIMYLTYC